MKALGVAALLFVSLCMHRTEASDLPLTTRKKVEEKYVYGLISRDGRVLVRTSLTELYTFREGRAEFSRDGRWGHLNENGQIVGRDDWDEAWAFVDGLARVKKESKFGYVNLQGTLVIPVELLAVSKSGFSKGVMTARTTEGTGIVDNRGKWVIPPKFSAVGRDPETDKIFRVRRVEGQIGDIVDASGRTLISNASGSTALDPDAGLFGFARGEKEALRWGLFNISGTVILEPEWLKVELVLTDKRLRGGIYALFTDDLAHIRAAAQKANVPVVEAPQSIGTTKNGTLWVNAKGAPIIAFAFQPSEIFTSTPASPSADDDLLLIVAAGADRQKRFGIVSSHGKIIAAPEYGVIDDYKSSFRVSLPNSGGMKATALSGLLARDGSWIVRPIRDLGEMRSYRIPYRAESGKYGYKDVAGRTVVPPKYGWASEFGDDGQALVCVSDQLDSKTWGVIDSLGDFVIQPRYCFLPAIAKGWEERHLYNGGLPDVHWFLSKWEGLVAACPSPGTDHKVGVVNGAGVWVVPPQYHKISFSKDLIFANLRQKDDQAGWHILETISTDVYERDGTKLLSKQGKLELLGLKSTSFGGAEEWEKDAPLRTEPGAVYRVTSGRKMGLVDGSGRTVIPTTFEKIQRIELRSSSVLAKPRLYLVQEQAYGEKWALFDHLGKQLTPMVLDFHAFDDGGTSKEPFKVLDDVLHVLADGKWLYFDAAGKLIWEEK